MGTKELQRLMDNKSLVALKKFAAAEAQLKELKAKHDEVIAQITDAMIANGVTRLEGTWGYITLAERTTYKLAEGVTIEELPEQFSKRVLDTEKVKAQRTLSGDLPGGVVENKTQYITKKLKEVE